MYSPKIREDLIPKIYREAKKTGVKMTVWANALLNEEGNFRVYSPAYPSKSYTVSGTSVKKRI